MSSTISPTTTNLLNDMETTTTDATNVITTTDATNVITTDATTVMAAGSNIEEAAVIVNDIIKEVISEMTCATTADTTTTVKTCSNSFTEINKLLDLVRLENIATCGNKSYVDCLKDVLKVNHYWPQLQMKPFFGFPGLVLLHNTYKRKDVTHFEALYEECRSVVLDLHAPAGHNVVVTLANAIPKQMKINEYEALAQDDDICETSYEGTMVNVYFARDAWHFSTTSCPTINSSRYGHPTKTHGDMLDEALAKLVKSDDQSSIRERFTATLDQSKAYTFILVHYENCRLVDHSAELGSNYATLVHIGTRLRETNEVATFQPFDLENQTNGIKLSRKFSGSAEAIEWLRAQTSQTAYGIIVKRANGQLFKVQPDEIVQRDQQDMGHSNPWHNMLWVYMQNNPEYKVDNYIAQYYPTLFTNQVSPTYILHTTICTMQDILYNLYRSTTFFSMKTLRYTLYREVDESLPPILRFHLAQLRFIQITTHTHAPINKRAIYRYICNNTIKNFRLLLHFFAMFPADLNAQAHTAMVHLDAALRQTVISVPRSNSAMEVA